MASHSNSMEPEMCDAYDTFSIGEEEEDSLVLKNDDIGIGQEGLIDARYCLVGRFLTDKVINFPAMKNTMAALWRPGKGVCIKDLSPTLFLFHFFHEVDLKHVIDLGPWTFDQHVLILKRLGENEQPHRVPLFHTLFWVQVYNLPIGFLSEKVLTNIGNYIREFQASDPNNFMGVWRNYMRIRVSIDVRQPLKRRLRLKKEGGEWFWVEFKYERLNTFCFICRLLGHTEKLCPKLYDCVDAELVRTYGLEMKAPTRRNAMSAEERWLHLAPSKDSVLNFGSSTDLGKETHLNVKNASKSGVSKSAKILNISGSGGCELMESMTQSKQLQVAKAIGK
ncbi:hypothetical protein AB3S75_020141 [Citrus x aurantiifolia]